VEAADGRSSSASVSSLRRAEPRARAP
jgi:hypothetical protein